MSITTRRPTGLPSWPVLLIAGMEKAGKTYAAAEASAAPLITRTFWITIGEDDPDEYGAIPGADFDIVAHDGTYKGVLSALTDAVEAGREGTTLIVLDSATRLWDLLCDMAQAEANRRATAKARKYSKPLPEDDVTIGMDLWNTAKQRWAHVMDLLRSHQGPSIVTARMEQTAVVDDRGDPTKEKIWKVKAEKSLPFDVGVVVQLRALGDAYVTGVRSLRFKPSQGEATPYPDFTVADLWKRLGCNDAALRSHATNDPMGEQRDLAAVEQRGPILGQIAEAAEAAGFTREDIAQRWAEEHDGEPIGQTLNIPALQSLLADLSKAAKAA